MVKKSGFSLIELTVVIGLLSLLILAISSTMLMSIVSSNRIRTTTKVKQAGNFAITQIQTMLRNAKAISLCDSTNSTVSFINPDGGETFLTSEIDNSGLHTRIASGSGIYLTPANTDMGTSFSLSCEPIGDNPTLVKLSFDLQDTLSARPTENPLLHFETSINLRNE